MDKFNIAIASPSHFWTFICRKVYQELSAMRTTWDFNLMFLKIIIFNLLQMARLKIQLANYQKP